MAFKDLMIRLDHWILTTWNPNRSGFEVVLKAADASQTKYNLTPKDETHEYLLMSFEQKDQNPPYQIYENLDNCKIFFKGIARFQNFHDAIRALLDKNTLDEECKTTSALKM